MNTQVGVGVKYDVATTLIRNIIAITHCAFFIRFGLATEYIVLWIITQHFKTSHVKRNHFNVHLWQHVLFHWIRTQFPLLLKMNTFKVIYQLGFSSARFDYGRRLHTTNGGIRSGAWRVTATLQPVSYTHLDVYKRQVVTHMLNNIFVDTEKKILLVTLNNTYAYLKVTRYYSLLREGIIWRLFNPKINLSLRPYRSTFTSRSRRVQRYSQNTR